MDDDDSDANDDDSDDDEVKYGNAQVDYMLSELVTQQQEGFDDNDECDMDYGDKSYDSEDDCTGGTAAFGEYRYESE